MKEGQQRFVDTTRIEENTQRPLAVASDCSALCQTLDDGTEQQDWGCHVSRTHDAVKKVGVQEFGGRTSLLWNLASFKLAG